MNVDTREQLQMIHQRLKELFGLYRNAVNNKEISDNEFWILCSLLDMDGEVSQHDISSLWSLSKQTVNTIIKNMGRRGLVRLETVPGTRNRKNIYLTDAGKQYAESIVNPILEIEQRAFDQLTMEERAAFMGILKKYTTALKKELS